MKWKFDYSRGTYTFKQVDMSISKNPTYPKYPAYILAGGKSSRFKSDKARAVLNGTPMLNIVAESLQAVSSRVIVVADSAEKYNDLGLETIADKKPDMGPLGGLQTAIAHASANMDLISGKHAKPIIDNEWFFLCQCDVYGVSDKILQVLTMHVDASFDAIAFFDTYWQPMPALYNMSLAQIVDDCMKGERSLTGLLRSANSLKVDPPDEWSLVRDLNYKADLDLMNENLNKLKT